MAEQPRNEKRSLDSLIDKKVLLAPMAGVTDLVFRRICRASGADLTYTEMVSAKGLSYANEKTRNLIELDDDEAMAAVQLFGHEPDTMAAQAQWIEDQLGDRLAYIDINMGCPARKITSKGDGSALMKDVSLASKIVASVSGAIEHPCTVKFRRGYNVDEETCVDFAKAMEQSGASAVAVHGRYAMQMYRGKADWDAIARVVDAIDIPVIGNGDVVDADSAKQMIDSTGCNAIMIGRGACGNPWVFGEVKAALSGLPYDEPSVTDRIDMARRHAKMLAELGGKQIVKMRKHAMWYVAGLPGASIARGRFNECNSFEEFSDVFDELLSVQRR